jgi:hypothetical protein
MSIEHDVDPGLLRIDPDVWRRIESYARTVGATPAEVIRKAFEEYQAAHDRARTEEAAEATAFDVMDRAGLVGCIKGASRSPADLSTNPIHMEGFGRE